MFKNKKIMRGIALMIVIIMSALMFASCGGDQNNAQLGVSGSVSGGISGKGDGENNAQTPGNTDDGTNDTPGADDGSNKPGDDSTPGTDDTTPGDNTKPGDNKDDDSEGGDGGNDPYAAMKADTSGTKVKFMTQNLRYDALDDRGTDNDARVRRYRFQELIKKYDPDIFVAQECCSTWIQILQEDFSDTYSMYYKYRGATSGSDEASPVLWKKSKYDKIGEGTFWLSETPNVASESFVSGYYPRVVSWVKLKDKATGEKITAYSTHFGFDYTEDHLKKINRLITDSFAKNADSYCILAGDFNLFYGSPQFLTVVDEVKITNLWDVAVAMEENGHCKIGELRNGTSNGFKENDGGNVIDFITAAPRKNLTVDYVTVCYDKIAVPNKGVNEGFVSDHFALYAELRVGTKVSYAEYYSDSAF